MTLGEELRAIRNSLGLSLQAVEEKSGGRVMAAKVGSYERGTRQPSVAKARELLAVYAEFGAPGHRLVLLRPGDVVHRADHPGASGRYASAFAAAARIGRESTNA